ncbi:hypothetical protein G3A39_40815 [Paraburkholderia aspalathi]|nr:hypothetical protein [Paraburkholderia aspalathi]
MNFEIDRGGQAALKHTGGRDSFSGRFEEDVLHFHKSDVERAASIYAKENYPAETAAEKAASIQRSVAVETDEDKDKDTQRSSAVSR